MMSELRKKKKRVAASRSKRVNRIEYGEEGKEDLLLSFGHNLFFPNDFA